MSAQLIFTLIIILILILSSVVLIINIRLSKKESKKINFHSISMQLLAVIVWTAILTNLFVPGNNLNDNVQLGIIIFLTSVIIGIFLIRSIFREMEIERTVENLIEKINENNDALKRLEEQKTEFVSVASHQLRGPISSIIGHISMMMEGDYGSLPKYLHQPMSRIYKSSSSLAILINDFLNVSRIEKGEMEYLIEDFNLNLVVKSLIPDFKILAKEKNINIVKEVNNKKISVRGDINKVRQVISNIVDNAIKYTVEGDIIITCEKNADSATVSVKDSGIGIDEKFGQEIFKKFVRDEEAIKMDVAGTGLGLFVASIMINAMGGKIWAESEGRGKGSTFFIKLPLSKG